jgi:hypothetical protein
MVVSNFSNWLVMSVEEGLIPYRKIADFIHPDYVEKLVLYQGWSCFFAGITGPWFIIYVPYIRRI